MIPSIGVAILVLGAAAGAALADSGKTPTTTAPAPASAPTPAPPSAAAVRQRCLESGDGYFRAHLGGAVEATVDWRNEGTRCEGESKYPPPGVRLSFQHAPSKGPDLLFVFGLTGVVEGRAAREVGTNLTVIVQGTSQFYGTRGDSRCTVDSLTQRRLGSGRSYRLEARGFCTQPAHAVRGDGAVLVSTFEFAGLVNYEPPKDESPH
jgi:hypothetical protein